MGYPVYIQQPNMYVLLVPFPFCIASNTVCSVHYANHIVDGTLKQK